MFIAIVDFAVAATDRETALAALLADAEAIGSMPGNIAFRPYLDPVRPDALCIVHEWGSAEAFAAYSASPCFNRMSATLRPMMTSKPTSRRMTAQLLENGLAPFMC